mgnify:CR=1 FL=1
MNKKVLVFGSGISGIGACRLLESMERDVILYDGNPSLNPEELKRQIGEDTSVQVILGDLQEEILHTLDLVVMSPGVPTDLPIVNKMRDMGIPIWGEIELAFAACTLYFTLTMAGNVLSTYPEGKSKPNTGTFSVCSV